MNVFQELIVDEYGFVVSSEAVLVGTLAVLGASVGLSAVSKTVNDELVELAYAFRSLDQTYHIEGQSVCGAAVASSHYTQPPVEESLSKLCAEIDSQARKHSDQESPKRSRRVRNQK